MPPDDQMSTDREPISSGMRWLDDYDDVQVLTLIRMWSGFEPEFITDVQLMASLEFDYPDAYPFLPFSGAFSPAIRIY